MNLIGFVDKLLEVIEKHSKYLFIFNLCLIGIFWGGIAAKKLLYGYVFQKDISLSGGVVITIHYPGITAQQIKDALSDKKYNVYSAGNLIYIEGKDINVTRVINELNEKLGIKLTKDNYEVREFSPYFGTTIFNEFSKLLIITLILICGVIFVRMRNWISSLAIFLTIIFDLGATMFFLAVTNYPISTISFVAFLMILGYAIDNNIVLATNIFKEEGEFRDKVKLSLKVGYMMELTTMLVLLIIYIFINAKIIRELAMILLIALLVDAYFYLFGNVPLYKYFLNVKKEES